jgi:hypothetical protein
VTLRLVCVLLAFARGCRAWDVTVHASEIDRFIRIGVNARDEQL